MPDFPSRPAGLVLYPQRLPFPPIIGIDIVTRATNSMIAKRTGLCRICVAQAEGVHDSLGPSVYSAAALAQLPTQDSHSLAGRNPDDKGSAPLGVRLMNRSQYRASRIGMVCQPECLTPS
eukprot:1489051-Rhodomonas_salina.3